MAVGPSKPFLHSESVPAGLTKRQIQEICRQICEEIISDYSKEALCAANKSLNALYKDIHSDVTHDFTALNDAFKALNDLSSSALEKILKFTKDTAAHYEHKQKNVDECLRAMEAHINKLPIKEGVTAVALEVAQSEVGKLSGEPLKELIAKMLPDLLKAFSVADAADIAAVEKLCEKIEDKHEQFVARVSQSSSSANQSVEEIQNNIAKIFNDQQQMKDEFDRLKAENAELSLTVSSFSDNVEKEEIKKKGGDGRKAKAPSKSKAPQKKGPSKQIQPPPQVQSAAAGSGSGSVVFEDLPSSASVWGEELNWLDEGLRTKWMDIRKKFVWIVYFIKLPFTDMEAGDAWNRFLQTVDKQDLVRTVVKIAAKKKINISVPVFQYFDSPTIPGSDRVDRGELDALVYAMSQSLKAEVGSEKFKQIRDGIYASFKLVSSEKIREDRAAGIRK